MFLLEKSHALAIYPDARTSIRRAAGGLLLGGGILLGLALRAVAADAGLPEVEPVNWTPLEQYSFFEVDPSGWQALNDYTAESQQDSQEMIEVEALAAKPEDPATNQSTQVPIAPLARSLNLPGIPLAPGVQRGYVENEEMFEFESSGWMSFERYADKMKRFGGEEISLEETAIATTEAPPDGETTSSPATQTVQMSRPLNLPLMPNLIQNYDIQISSTEDENPEQLLAQPDRALNLPVMPGLGDTGSTRVSAIYPSATDITGTEGELGNLPESMWEDATTSSLNPDEADTLERERSQLNVRLAGLPNSQITPIPGKPATKQRSALIAKTTFPKLASKNATTPKAATVTTPRNPEVCAALTAYKRQQLAAIEKDRETLFALQAAVTELGLTQKLDFLNSVTGSLNNRGNMAGTAQTDGAKPISDSPESPAPTAKN